MQKPALRVCVLFLANWIALASAACLLRALGLEFLCGDDFPRLSLAMGFAENPSLAPGGTFWLPLHFWLYGSWYALGGRAMNTFAWCWPLSVTLLASAIVFLQQAALRLLRGNASASGHSPRQSFLVPLLVLLVAMSMPLLWRLTNSGMSEVTSTLLYGGVIWVLAAPSVSARDRIIALLMLMGLQMVRYETWPFVFGAWALVVWQSRHLIAHPRIGWGWLGAGWAALWIFPAVWMLYNFRAEGDPLAFLAHARTQINFYPRLESFGVPARFGYLLLKLIASAWIVLLLALFGGALGRRVVWPLLALTALYLPVYGQALFNYTIHTIAIERVALPLCLAMVPLAGAGFFRYAQRHGRDRRLSTVLLIPLLLAVQAYYAFGLGQIGQPVLHPDDRAIVMGYARHCRHDGWLMVYESRDYGQSMLNYMRVYVDPRNVVLPEWLGPQHAGRQLVWVTDQPRAGIKPAAWLLRYYAVYELQNSEADRSGPFFTP